MMKKFAAVWLIAFILAFGSHGRAESGPIITINEIAWMGAASSPDDEWIELANRSAEAVDLSGWVLEAVDGIPRVVLAGMIPGGGFFLLERPNDDTVPEIPADQIYTGALKNEGEILVLKDGAGREVGRIDGSAGWPAGNKSLFQTMELGADGQWQTSQLPGGTARTQNSQVALEDSDADSGSDSGQENKGNENQNDAPEGSEVSGGGVAVPAPAPGGRAGAVQKNFLGKILINEFVSDPADEAVEWIELYNTVDGDVGLDGWFIEDGGGAKTFLSGSIGKSGAGRFFVVEKPKGSLNNSGDIIRLRDKSGALIDQVAYGNWDDGDAGNNAPKAGDPDSVARKIDGYSTFNNFHDFSLTIRPTKGAGNLIMIEEESSQAETTESAQPGDGKGILLSEIFPNPAGTDDLEFVEIFNSGPTDIDISGWRLGDSSKTEYKIIADKNSGRRIIPFGGYLAVERQESRIALNNSGDTVKLSAPGSSQPIAEVKYEKAAENESYSLNENSGRWEWTSDPTPGRKNFFGESNQGLSVDFVCPASATTGVPVLFDASDAFFSENAQLSYRWDFSDGITNQLMAPEHTFFQSGALAVKLTVAAGDVSASKECLIIVNESLMMPDKTATASTTVAKKPATLASVKSQVVITELLPNPEGTDKDGEWIELKNIGKFPVNLLGWKLSDESLNKKPFVISADINIAPGGFYLLKRADSGIALNNTLDNIRLFDAEGEIADEIDYEKAVSGRSYARQAAGGWSWTEIPTPGANNVIRNRSDNGSEPGIKIASAKSGAIGKNSGFVKTDMAALFSLPAGQRVRVSGTAAVLPGVLGPQFFYAVAGGSGMQIYSYKKEFPRMVVGDFLEITGEISESAGEKRIKIGSAADIRKMNRSGEPAPRDYSCDSMNDPNACGLARVTAQVTERKGSVVFIDDGTDEAVVYIKKYTGIDPGMFEEGSKYAIAGIIGRTNSGSRLMPRSPADVVLIGTGQENREEGRVLGVMSDNPEIQIEPKPDSRNFWRGLALAMSTILLVSAVAFEFIRWRKQP